MKNKIIWIVFAANFLAGVRQGRSQDLMTIEACLQKAKENFPVVSQLKLIDQITEVNLSNISKGYYPQISLLGTITTQSDVTSLPIKIPNFTLPDPPSKNQYKVYSEITQIIYDGGQISQQKKLAKANANVEKARAEIEIYTILDKVAQLYFGILQLQEQKKIADLNDKDLVEMQSKLENGVKNGTVFKSQYNQISSERIKLQQKLVEISSAVLGMQQGLSILTGIDISKSNLIMPKGANFVKAERPELIVFENQKESLLLQSSLINVKTKPKLGLFFQGGIGRPGLNFLDNNPAWYYLGGLRLQWNLSSFYTYSKEKQQINIQISGLDLYKKSFLMSNAIKDVQLKNEIDKYQQLQKMDQEAIALREQIYNTAKVQLDNGIITSSDYIREMNQLDQARQNRILHLLQEMQAKYSAEILNGIQN